LSYRSFQKLRPPTHLKLYFTVLVRTFIFGTLSSSVQTNSWRSLKTFLKGKLFILISVGKANFMDVYTASITACT